MYANLKNFAEIEDHVKIWKYLDLFKYLDLIHTKQLFLLRADLYPDLFEGRGLEKSVIKELFNDSLGFVTKAMIDMNGMVRRSSYINSWHINESESSVMWDAYSNPNGGIVIQSTAGDLKKSITDSRQVYISKVIYDRDNMDMDNALKPLIYKRIEFKEERELRIFLSPDITRLVEEKESYTNLLPESERIDIDPNTLIKKAFFHPRTPDWVVNSIKNVINHYGYVPQKSTLYS